MKNKSPKKIGVVFGATGYIGSRLSMSLAEKGHDLIISGRSAKKLKKVSDDIKRKVDCNINIVKLDFDNISIKKLESEFKVFSKDIKFIINTSAVQDPIGNFVDIDFKRWRKNIKINLLAPALITQYFLKVFRKNKYGNILLFSGGGGTSARPNFSAYSSSKSGIVRFVENISHEVKEYGVRINAIAPGPTPSKMMNEILKHRHDISKTEFEKATITLNNMDFKMDKILELSYFLVSEESTGISGKIISAEWDNWKNMPLNLHDLNNSDVYTLRRIVGKDRNFAWGDL